jgi:hypothetical protein
MAKQAAAVVNDPTASLIKASQPALIKIDIPESVVDRFEADVFLDQSMAHAKYGSRARAGAASEYRRCD